MRLALPVFLALAACGPGSPETQAVLSTPSATQVTAQQACHSEILGRVIPQAVKVLDLRDGGASVYTVNGPGISISQARSINQCARLKLASGDIGVPRATVAHPDVSEVKSQRSFVASPGCPAGASVLYGGAQYCLNR